MRNLPALALLFSTGVGLAGVPAAGLPTPFELFGDPGSAVGNPLAFDVSVGPSDPLSGRQTTFRMVLTASAGLFVEPLPTVGRAGSGADVELGDALDSGDDPAGWQIELLDDGVGSATLVFRIAALPAASPVAEGAVVRVAAYSLKIAELDGSLDQEGTPLAVHVGFDDGSGAEIQGDDVRIVETVVGLGIDAPDAYSRIESAEGIRFYRSARIELAAAGYCAGFPDGAGSAPTENCTQQDTFRLDPADDLVVVEVRGAALEPLLSTPDAAITLNSANDCGPTTELDAVPGPFVQPTDGDEPELGVPSIALSFFPSEVPTEETDAITFVVCALTGARFVDEKRLSIDVSVDFASSLLRIAEPTESTLTLLPSPYGDERYGDPRPYGGGPSGPDSDRYPSYQGLMLFGEPTTLLAGSAFLFIVLVSGGQLREHRKAVRAERSSRR